MNIIFYIILIMTLYNIISVVYHKQDIANKLKIILSNLNNI